MGNCFNKTSTQICSKGLNNNKNPINYTKSKSENLNHNYIIKILVIGDAKVGKTSILKCLTQNTIDSKYIPTLGLEFYTYKIQHDGKILKLQLWDSAGDKRFSTIVSAYYKGSEFIILVTDLTDIKSIQNSEQYIENVKNVDSNTPIILVGNKSDEQIYSLHRERVQSIVSKYNLKYFEVSALNGSGIEKLFNDLDYSSLTEEKVQKDQKSYCPIKE